MSSTFSQSKQKLDRLLMGLGELQCPSLWSSSDFEVPEGSSGRWSASCQDKNTPGGAIVAEERDGCGPEGGRPFHPLSIAIDPSMVVSTSLQQTSGERLCKPMTGHMSIAGQRRDTLEKHTCTHS